MPFGGDLKPFQWVLGSLVSYHYKEQIKGKKKLLSEKVSLIKEDISTVENRKKEIRSSVEEYFQKLIDALKNRMNELVNEVESHCSTKLEALFSKQKTLQQTVQHASDCCLFTDCAVKQGSDVEILSVGQIVIHRLSSLVEEIEQKFWRSSTGK
ncbi:hypothetical protein ACROYT_G031789 [Oculina patagonica]